MYYLRFILSFGTSWKCSHFSLLFSRLYSEAQAKCNAAIRLMTQGGCHDIIETSDHSKNKLFRLLKSSVIDSLTSGIKPYLVKNLCGGITASFSS